jgi:hypothetical protein
LKILISLLVSGFFLCSCQCCGGAKSTASQQYQMVEEENKAPVLYSAYRK